jgi:hypothetical protein
MPFWPLPELACDHVGEHGYLTLLFWADFDSMSPKKKIPNHRKEGISWVIEGRADSFGFLFAPDLYESLN